jgi:hypothetical protein
MAGPELPGPAIMQLQAGREPPAYLAGAWSSFRSVQFGRTKWQV